MHWIFLVLTASLEWANARVPRVVTSETESRASDAEGWVATNEIGLRKDDLHRPSRLLSFYGSDKGPQHVERPEHLVDGEDPPAAVRLPGRLGLPNAGDRAEADRIPESDELRRDALSGSLWNVEDWYEEVRVGPMLFEARGALAIKEAAGPGELFAHRPRPNHRRRRCAKSPFELSSFDGAKPRSDPFDHLGQIRSRCCLPVVQRLPVLEDDRPFEPPDADDAMELGENLGHAVDTSLVDLRVHASAFAVRPALAVEESRGPGEVVTLQGRELDRTERSCLSPKCAKTSSKCARAVAQMCAG